MMRTDDTYGMQTLQRIKAVSMRAYSASQKPLCAATGIERTVARSDRLETTVFKHS